MIEDLIASIPPGWRLSTLAEHAPEHAGSRGGLWFATLVPRGGGNLIVASAASPAAALRTALAKVQSAEAGE